MSRTKPSSRLSRVALRSRRAPDDLPAPAHLDIPGPCGMMQRVLEIDSVVRAAGRRGAGAPPAEARIMKSKERSRGEHEVGSEADATERGETPAQRALRSKLRGAIKTARTVEGHRAPTAVLEAIRALDKAVARGVVHRNTAARKKSALARRLGRAH